jgi:hypothetical protein
MSKPFCLKCAQVENIQQTHELLTTNKQTKLFCLNITMHKTTRLVDKILVQ